MINEYKGRGKGREGVLSPQTGAEKEGPASTLLEGLTPHQLRLLSYLADLRDELATRDYSKYGPEADSIRNSELLYMERVGRAILLDRPIWS